ncbi:MAG: chitobiase/beta-hexosaminidase C-terminal domain-containing protein [Euryarchaeota archaeon]|nr:chitobiase/beta-hexosaminidase C-terminal domain-containing protein [Euryarchaeota archaeon]
MEIVAVSSGGVYIFDGYGNELYRFGINSNTAVPAIGDVDRDGINDVVIASNIDKKIYIISNGSLQEFSSTGRISSNIALGDLNRDGNIEIAGGDIYNYIYIWDRTGALLERQKVSGAIDYFSSALITDLERDGNKELILGNNNGNIYAFTYWNLSAETTPPMTTDDVGGAWHNSSVTVTLTAVDMDTGVEATYYTVDGTLPGMNSPIGNVIHLSKDRIYTIRYFSVDNVGNAEDVRTTVNQVKIDTAPPSTYDDADNLWHSTAVALNLTASDSFSGVAFLYYIVDGTENNSIGNVTLNFIEEGVHTIEYYSMDYAGNIESRKSALAKLDMTSPSTTDDADGLWHNSNVTINLSAIDNGSGVNTTYYKVTQVSMSPLGSFVSWLSGILGLEEGFTEGNTVLISDDGVFDISYYSIDNLGNTEELKTSMEVKIDKSTPQTGASSYINGTVLDYSTQEVIPYAKVTTNTSITATANETGFYSLLLDSGSYILTAESDPKYYVNSSVMVEVQVSEVVQDIELVKKPTGTISGSVKNV